MSDLPIPAIPGPWAICRADRYARSIVPVRDPGDLVCTIQFNEPEVLDALAALISAAPEMYEALSALVAALPNPITPGGEEMPWFDALDAARTALLIAQGDIERDLADGTLR